MRRSRAHRNPDSWYSTCFKDALPLNECLACTYRQLLQRQLIDSPNAVWSVSLSDHIPDYSALPIRPPFDLSDLNHVENAQKLSSALRLASFFRQNPFAPFSDPSTSLSWQDAQLSVVPDALWIIDLASPPPRPNLTSPLRHRSASASQPSIVREDVDKAWKTMATTVGTTKERLGLRVALSWEALGKAAALGTTATAFDVVTVQRFWEQMRLEAEIAEGGFGAALPTSAICLHFEVFHSPDDRNLLLLQASWACPCSVLAIPIAFSFLAQSSRFFGIFISPTLRGRALLPHLRSPPSLNESRDIRRSSLYLVFDLIFTPNSYRAVLPFTYSSADPLWMSKYRLIEVAVAPTQPRKPRNAVAAPQSSSVEKVTYAASSAKSASSISPTESALSSSVQQFTISIKTGEEEAKVAKSATLDS
ncbi:hypothetical protein JCM11641_001686 [Rhodosporidiobolus odoratus]